MAYLFGPVLSRRLGLSLGVDLLNHKTCNLDCIYCELGKTKCTVQGRGRFISPESVFREIRSRAEEEFDHLTFAGSGEPTLSTDLGDIIRRSKEIVKAPIAVITNSTLLTSREVRRELGEADIVLPSLDAASQETFEIINRPAKGLHINEIINGLRSFRTEFSGEIWLEVMLVKDVNCHEIEKIARAAESVDPDRIQLNTVIRPPAWPAKPLDEEEITNMLNYFSEAEIIPDYDWNVPEYVRAKLLGILSARPCTIDEIGLHADLENSLAIKYTKILERDGLVQRFLLDGKHYFKATNLD